MYDMEECVSFRTLNIGYELQGARSQLELVLATPVQGVQVDGRLILGDPKLLRASALKS